MLDIVEKGFFRLLQKGWHVVPADVARNDLSPFSLDYLFME